MVYGVATREWDGWGNCIQSWVDNASRFYPVSAAKHKPVLEAFQQIYEQTTEPIISYCHDDLMIEEKNWDLRVLMQFEDPQVGLVGFGGALGHGLPQLYTQPFHIPNLIRREFMSNLKNAEANGYRFDGETDVAVLDGFSIFVRRSVLDKWGGWPVNSKLGYWMYCEALCCETRRQGKKIRLVGVKCDHLGGKTVGMVPLTDDYTEAHREFYETNRDMLPYYVS
jgi:hypothetical protein